MKTLRSPPYEEFMKVPIGTGQESSVRTHNTPAITEHLIFPLYYHTWALIHFLSIHLPVYMALTLLNNAGEFFMLLNKRWTQLTQNTWQCLYLRFPFSRFDLTSFPTDFPPIKIDRNACSISIIPPFVGELWLFGRKLLLKCQQSRGTQGSSQF